METGQDAPAQRLDVVDVFREAMRAVGANFPTFLVIALITTIPTSAMGFGIQVYFAGSAGELADPNRALGVLGQMLGAYGAMMILAMVIGSFGHGAAIYATVEHLVGRKASIGSAISVGLGRIVWLLLCSLLVGLISAAGSALCLLPGLIAWIWLSVSLPAVVVERLGPIAAIQRSIELTEGNRLPIALAYLVLFGALFGFSCCIAGPIGAVAGVSQPGELPDPFAPAQIVLQLLSFVVSLGFFMAFVSVTSVVYARLRGLHDGVDATELAKVFS